VLLALAILFRGVLWKRVLKPEGQLVFIEHGRSPDPGVLAWQNRLNPIWKRVAGGCNLNRKIDELITGAGFRVTQIETAYRGRPKAMEYLYEGRARRPSPREPAGRRSP
jgi:ubiquinone/menaquinone biosynthesis C-methylase UbiE